MSVLIGANCIIEYKFVFKIGVKDLNTYVGFKQIHHFGSECPDCIILEARFTLNGYSYSNDFVDNLNDLVTKVTPSIS